MPFKGVRDLGHHGEKLALFARSPARGFFGEFFFPGQASESLSLRVRSRVTSRKGPDSSVIVPGLVFYGGGEAVQNRSVHQLNFIAGDFVRVRV